jgi:hypothetical protein
MNLNNTYKICWFLYKKHNPTPTRVEMPLEEWIHRLTHSLIQQGDGMRKKGSGAPPSATKNITTSSCTEGRKF